MSESKAKELFYGLDLYSANPTWRVNKGFSLNTWKSLLGTLVIVLTSLGLSYQTIRLLDIEKSQLPIEQAYEKSDELPPDPFIIAFKFESAQDVIALNIDVTDTISNQKGRAVLQPSCPKEISSLGGWTTCYMITSKSMPYIETITNMVIVPDHVAITTTSNSDYTLYLQRFTVPSALGSTAKQFYNVRMTLGNQIYIRSMKSRLSFSNSLVERGSVQNYVGLDYEISSAVPPFFPMNDCTIHITYDSSVETTFYNIRRPTLFDLLEVFLGWFQLFTMFLSYVFFFVNSFNIKLQYCQFLFNHVDIQRAKVSILFFIRLVIVYALDFVKCKTCLQALKKKGYLRQEIVCFAAFEELDDELSIQKLSRSIAVLKHSLNPANKIEREQYSFDYRFQQKAQSESEQPMQDSALFDMLSCKRYQTNRVNKRKHHNLAWWKRFFMWFDVNSHSVEPNLRSNQRASIFSIVLTYNWIIATALIVCLLGILSLPTAPILLYRNAKFNYTYTVDFKTQPVYLFHVNSTQPHHIVDFNASLIDISFKTLSKLQITNGSDCPPPPSLMTQDKAAIYCITGTANVTIDEYGQDNILMITVSTSNFSSGARLQIYNYNIKNNQIVNSVITYSIVGTTDECKVNPSTPIYDRDQAKGMSISLKALSSPDGCLQNINGRDRIGTKVFAFPIRKSFIVRKQGSIDFFSATQEGWNVSLIFIFVLAYLIARPYNKRMARLQVASEIPLKQPNQVQNVLDMASLLMYVRTKEADLGSDRFFHKSQLKLE